MVVVQCNPVQPKDAYRSVQGIIFDCDGVLIDSKEANRRYYNTIRQKAGLGPMSPEQEDFVHAHSVQRALEHILPAELLGRMRRERSRVDYREFLFHIRLESGLLPLLTELKNKGIPMAVNTNRTDTMDLILERFELRPYFHPVVTANRVCWAKPHPESLHRILGFWRLKPEQVAYIGDSSVDQDTAGSAGVPFWAYKNPLLRADLHVPDFWALLGCFRRA